MRKRQEQTDKNNYELKDIINEISECSDIPQDLLQKLKLLVCSEYSIQTCDQCNSIFRCGRSKAGQAFQNVLDILDNLSVSYELLFEENDLDIKVRYNDKEYQCEIVLNESAEKPVKGIRVKKEQRECWAVLDGEYGILYYYMKTGRLEFYSVGEKIELLVCLKEF